MLFRSRTGCFCNPGAGELALNIRKEDLMECFYDLELATFEDFAKAVTERTDADAAGAVRVSVGIATTFEDVYALVQMLKTFLNVRSEGFVWE